MLNRLWQVQPPQLKATEMAKLKHRRRHLWKVQQTVEVQDHPLRPVQPPHLAEEDVAQSDQVEQNKNSKEINERI